MRGQERATPRNDALASKGAERACRCCAQRQPLWGAPPTMRFRYGTPRASRNASRFCGGAARRREHGKSRRVGRRKAHLRLVRRGSHVSRGPRTSTDVESQVPVKSGRAPRPPPFCACEEAARRYNASAAVAARAAAPAAAAPHAPVPSAGSCHRRRAPRPAPRRAACRPSPAWGRPGAAADPCEAPRCAPLHRARRAARAPAAAVWRSAPGARRELRCQPRAFRIGVCKGSADLRRGRGRRLRGRCARNMHRRSTTLTITRLHGKHATSRRGKPPFCCSRPATVRRPATAWSSLP